VQFDVRVEGNSIGSLAPSVTNGSFSEINHSFVSTTVEMAFGETVILAGIYDRTDNSSNSYTPVLGQIPGIGLFFSKDTTDSSRKSVVYMMTLRRSDNQEEDANSLNDDKRLSPEVKELQMRNLSWFSTVPNSALVMKGLSRLYREFRSGDIPNIYWWHSDMGQQDLYCHDNEISEAVKMLAS
jgi:Flp pilus assembly secretin CpaC